MNMKLENFIKGPLTSILGVVLMAFAFYAYAITKEFTAWQAGGMALVGFMLGFMRLKLEDFVSEFIKAAIEKFRNKTMIIFALMASSVCYSQVQTDAQLTNQINTTIRGKVYNATTAGNMFKTIVDSKTSVFVTPEQFGAVGDGTTNDQVAITNAVASGKPVFFGPKNYRVTSTISLPDGVKLIGSGNGSIISTTSNISILTFSGSDITVDNITLSGNKTGAAQRGIDCQGNVGLTLARNNNMVSNVRFKSLTTGLYVSNMNLAGVNYGGIKIINSIAFDCNTGYFNDVRGEYTNYANCVAIGCVDGWTNNAGNNNWVGGQLTNNTTGVRMGAGTNDGHSVMTGAMINHNTTNVICIGVVKNYLFLGCMFYAGNITVNTSDFIRFAECEFGTNTITITNSNTEFENNFFETNPTWSITGTIPKLFNNSYATGISDANVINGSFQATGKILGNTTTAQAGFNTGSFTADPTTLANFDVFGNSTANVLKARLNGITNVIATSNLGTNTELAAMTASGTLQSSDFLSASGTKTMGLSSNAATSQTLTVDGSNANVDILIRSKANGIASLVNGTTTTNNITAQFNGVNMNSPNGTIAIGGGTNRFSFLSGSGGNELRMDNIANNYFGTATLVGGTVVVNNNKVTAQSIIFLTNAVSSGTVGALSVTARVAATSFTITSTSGTDTSTIGYIIIN